MALIVGNLMVGIVILFMGWCLDSRSESRIQVMDDRIQVMDDRLREVQIKIGKIEGVLDLQGRQTPTEQEFENSESRAELGHSSQALHR